MLRFVPHCLAVTTEPLDDPTDPLRELPVELRQRHVKVTASDAIDHALGLFFGGARVNRVDRRPETAERTKEEC